MATDSTPRSDTGVTASCDALGRNPHHSPEVRVVKPILVCCLVWCCREARAVLRVCGSLGWSRRPVAHEPMPRKKRPGTLATLLNALVGMEVVLELKSDVQVLGFVEWADNAMK